MDINRRDLCTGFGAAAAMVAMGSMATGAVADEAAPEVNYANFNAAIKSMLRMDCDLLAVKFYEHHEDVPETAIHPKADMGVHMATCQAFSMARYNGKHICMTKEDEWCWAPLVGFGQVDCEEGSDSFNTVAQFLMIEGEGRNERFYADLYPRLERGKYEAWVVAPLSTCDFDPDVVMVYADPFKINWLCLIAKRLEAKTVQSNFDGINSCVYEMVNTMSRQEYQICFPDPGEIVRARTKQTDAVFTIPSSKLDEFMNCAMTWGVNSFSFAFENQFEYPVDYTRPPFYNAVFEMWGLDTGTDWDRA